ncbi:MAG TPA: metal-dependent hydrolase [Gammaproteobacteria bacterium]|nr:metal-dependent hydrolase [Gammaproteobacteria bacterium]
MASLLAHSLVAVTAGKLYPHRTAVARFWWLAILCATLPDIDALWHWLGVPYASMWGHRGITHSLAFALLTGMIVARSGFPSLTVFKVKWWRLVAFFTLVTASHGLLDAMTNGGLGVAFFAPFDDARYFLPWRPIVVSPIGVRAFFSEWGWRVVKSELIWVGIPCALLLLLAWRRRK